MKRTERRDRIARAVELAAAPPYREPEPTYLKRGDVIERHEVHQAGVYVRDVWVAYLVEDVERERFLAKPLRAAGDPMYFSARDCGRTWR